ncbi:unnamed protein product [Brassica oleracea]
MERGCYQGDRHGDRHVGDFHLEEDQSPQHHPLHRHDRAYDALDPAGNITIKWDIFSWTADGYVAVVTIFNFQQYRHIQAPSWQLGWSWYKKEVIWSMVGAQATEQGDCSKFKGNIHHCCKKTPTVVDLLPGTPYNQQMLNSCRGGVISSWAQDPTTAVGRTTSSRSCNLHNHTPFDTASPPPPPPPTLPSAIASQIRLHQSRHHHRHARHNHHSALCLSLSVSYSLCIEKEARGTHQWQTLTEAEEPEDIFQVDGEVNKLSRRLNGLCFFNDGVSFMESLILEEDRGYFDFGLSRFVCFDLRLAVGTLDGVGVEQDRREEMELVQKRGKRDT